MTFLPPLPAVLKSAIELWVPVEPSERARWGLASWGDDLWQEMEWVDLTPQSMNAQVSWGASDPQGVLSATEAGRFSVETYDPQRLLDPSNTSSPYHEALRPGTQIRLRYIGIVSRTVRRGVIDSIRFSMASKLGRISATDGVADLAAITVPGVPGYEDTNELDNRIADILLRSNADTTKPGGVATGIPAVSVGAPDVENTSAWLAITRAALDALHAVWIDNDGALRARSLVTPVDSGVDIGGATGVPIDELEPSSSMAGVYTKVLAYDIEHPDRPVWLEVSSSIFAAATYERTRPIPDASQWVSDVLADRSGDAAARLDMGTIRPRTEAELSALIDVGMAHIVHVFVDSVFPPIALDVVVLGGSFEANTKTGWSAKLVGYVPNWGSDTGVIFLVTPDDQPLVTPASDPLIVEF